MTINVLSIDGGGIRGVIPATILDKIERTVEKPIWELFDLIAGTSTGGLLALGLTKPHPLEPHRAEYRATDLVELYVCEGDQIFSHPGLKGQLGVDQKYQSGPLEGLLKRYFKETPLRDALKNVMVTSYAIEAHRNPYVFKSWHAKSDKEKKRNHDFLMWEVARATSAAPTYFEPHQLEREGLPTLTLIDGGVFANNPAMCAYVEARKIKPDEDIFMLSLGTGHAIHPLPYGKVKDWSLFTWARSIIDIVLDGMSDNVDYMVNRLLNIEDMPNRYYRLQAPLTEDAARLDDARPDNIRTLRQLTETYLQENEQLINEVCAALRKKDEAPAM